MEGQPRRSCANCALRRQPCRPSTASRGDRRKCESCRLRRVQCIWPRGINFRRARPARPPTPPVPTRPAAEPMQPILIPDLDPVQQSATNAQDSSPPSRQDYTHRRSTRSTRRVNYFIPPLRDETPAATLTIPSLPRWTTNTPEPLPLYSPPRQPPQYPNAEAPPAYSPPRQPLMIPEVIIIPDSTPPQEPIQQQASPASSRDQSPNPMLPGSDSNHPPGSDGMNNTTSTTTRALQKRREATPPASIADSTHTASPAPTQRIPEAGPSTSRGSAAMETSRIDLGEGTSRAGKRRRYDEVYEDDDGWQPKVTPWRRALVEATFKQRHLEQVRILKKMAGLIDVEDLEEFKGLVGELRRNLEEGEEELKDL